MTSTPTRRPRPELDLVAPEGPRCACGPRCTLTGSCLETALTDGRFGIWDRRRRTDLRLAC